MGLFLSLSGIVGKTYDETIKSLRKYAQANGGGFEQENLTPDHNNCAVVKESNGNTTIYNPNGFLSWDDLSEFLSKDLNAPVFSFHIHDGDFWMYTLFVNGGIVDQFNPIPDYFEDNIPEQEFNRFKGNARTIATYVPGVEIKHIEKYLVHWDLDKENAKAYPDDEFTNEDWQLLDFIKKLNLPYPVNDDGTPGGQTYKLWTNDFPFQANESEASVEVKKPWWKFW